MNININGILKWRFATVKRHFAVLDKNCEKTGLFATGGLPTTLAYLNLLGYRAANKELAFCGSLFKASLYSNILLSVSSI